MFLAVLLGAPGAASAGQVICEAGSGPEQCSSPRDVAVDRETGLVFVADSGNDRILAFEADGSFVRAFGWGVADGSPELQVCTAGCLVGIPGAGAGQFDGMQGIAVDNDPAGPAPGDVYVLENVNDRVQRFHPSGELVVEFGDFSSQAKIDLGPGGVIHVADRFGAENQDRRVQKFDHEGNLIEAIFPLEPVGEHGNNLQGFAVEPEGGFYLANAGGRPVRRYDAGGSELTNLHPSANIQAIATDAAGDLFVADSSFSETAVYQYDPAGAAVRTFYGGGVQAGRAIGMEPFAGPAGDIFEVESSAFGLGRVVAVDFPPPGPLVHPDPALSEADPIAATKATLNARINPEGKASEYRFQYIEKQQYLEDGESFENAESSASLPLGAADYELHSAAAEIGCAEPESPPQPSCLTPETEYVFRALAKNADSEPQERLGPPAEFTTGPAFEILDAWSTEVGAESATIHGEVNPVGIEALAHLEHVSEQTYQADLGEGGEGFEHAQSSEEFELGASEAPLRFAAQLRSLSAGSAYRFRVVVENVFKGEAGAERRFATFPAPRGGTDDCPNRALRGGASADLAECRGYEMVSPPDKGGGEIEALVGIFKAPSRTQQAAAGGGGLAYSTYVSFGDAVSAQAVSQYLAERGAGGWSTRAISPPREGASHQGSFNLETQYKAFSEELEEGWLVTDSAPALDAGAIEGFANLYRAELGAGTPGYEAICSAQPPSESPERFWPEPQGSAEGGELAVFRANDKLSAAASGAKYPGTGEAIYQLYGCAGGEPELISVLPGGAASAEGSAVGTGQGGQGNHREDNLHNAVAEDGGRVYWSAYAEAVRKPGRIYLRENPLGEGGECAGALAPCTTAVSEPLSGSPARFWTASENGGRAIFSFTAGPLAGNLYAYDAEAHASSLIAAGVSGLAGWSEDASRLYLVSTKALAPGAEAGKDNLYLHEAGEGGGELSLVASLTGGAAVGGYCSIDAPSPFDRCARATPDGEALAFLSRDPLTGYDNVAAGGEERAAELFLYRAGAAGGEGELRCVSCNPSGARPAAREVDPSGPAPPVAVAARIPSWESAFHASRVLSRDGRRLFFESFDPLVLSDTNGALDVYEWIEAEDEAQCEGVGAELYVPSAGGCLSLISSGRSARDSEFVDASADGADVFFKTAESLLPQDPGLLDIYDARELGGFPPPPPEPPPCEGDACQSPPAPPQAPAPASRTFEGAGNPPARSGCARSARAARRSARRARRAARSRRAKRLSRRAKRLSRRAKRCRARQRRARS